MAVDNLQSSVEADENNFPGGFENSGDISFVHFSKIEAQVYDDLQDGAFLDEEMLPIRSYKPFGELLKDKDFLQLVMHVLHDSSQEGDPRTPELQEAQMMGLDRVENQGQEWVSAPGDDMPEIRELASKGSKPDSIIVYMPSNMIFFLGQISDGLVHINPHTGYPEFGRFGNVFKSIVRVGATLAGAVLGGPAGAALGSVAGSAVTGRKPRDWFNPAAQAGLITGAAHMAAPYIPGFSGLGGSMAASGIPGVAGMGGAMQNMATPSGNFMNVPNLFGGSNAAAPAAGGMSTLMGTGTSHVAGGAAPGQSSMMPGMMQALPYALSIGSGFLAKQGEKERYELEKKERAQFMREREELEEKNRRRFGFYTPLQKNTHADSIPNPRFGEPGEPAYLYKGDARYDAAKGPIPYAEGGEIIKKKKVPLKDGFLIKGPGKGQ